VDGGKARALAIVGKQRNSFMPQTPTMQEAGVPVPDLVVWGGIFAPAATPQPIVELLNRQFVAAGQAPDIKAAAAKTGSEVQPWSQAEFKGFVDSEIRKWDQVVRESGVHLD
jgi:tripartite-type tricarboxylate transporter receptor subunit TctC